MKDLKKMLAAEIGTAEDRKFLRNLDAARDLSYSIDEHDYGVTKGAFFERYVGFPELGGTVLVEEGSYERIVSLTRSSEDLIQEYVPTAYVSIDGAFTLEPMPSFVVGEWDLSVENNVRDEGPRCGPDSLPFYYVLNAESRFDTSPLLYANSADLLTWAAISFVYADFERDRFRDDFFTALCV